MTKRDRETALQASENRYLDAVRLVLHRANMQLANHHGITALVYALGQHSTVEWFILQELKKSRIEVGGEIKRMWLPNEDEVKQLLDSP